MLFRSLIMGAGIFAMHYGGMYAMQMHPGIEYNTLLVIISGLIKWYVSWVQNVARQFGPYLPWALEI